MKTIIGMAAVAMLFVPMARPQQSGQPSLSEKRGAPKSESIRNDAEQQRIRAVLLVRDFASLVKQFHDLSIKVPTLARLAELLWKDDQSSAEQLFTKALDLTSLREGASPEETRRLSSLRRQVLARMANCAPALLERLTRDENSNHKESERTKTDFAVALNLAGEDPNRSVEFAKSSLREGVNQGMYSLLLTLHAKNPKLADTLFLETLEQLAVQPFIDAENLLFLGTYVFTSPKLLLADPAAIVMTAVADLLVPDITSERPGTSSTLVRAYLNTVTRVLLRGTRDPQQEKLFYVTAYLLIPKAERFAPDLVPSLLRVMQTLARDIPAELTRESAYANIKKPGLNTPEDLEAALQEIEKLPNPMNRDIRYVSVIFQLWMKGEFVKAREVIENVSDLSVQTELQGLVNLGETARLLERPKIDFTRIEKNARKLLQGVGRAMVWVAIARARVDSGNVASANIALEEALISASKMDDVRRPYITMNAASQFARFDLQRGKVTLMTAVSEFNSQKPEALSKIEWNWRIELGPSRQPFPLKIKGFEYSLEATLQSLLAADRDETILAIRNLTNEKPLSDAMIAVSKAVLRLK